MSNKDQSEILSEVLVVTRDQLARSVNLNAELEALLNIERRRVAELEQELSELKNKSDKTDKSEK
jgi:hypothetical protein